MMMSQQQLRELLQRAAKEGAGKVDAILAETSTVKAEIVWHEPYTTDNGTERKGWIALKLDDGRGQPSELSKAAVARLLAAPKDVVAKFTTTSEDELRKAAKSVERKPRKDRQQQGQKPADNAAVQAALAALQARLGNLVGNGA